MHYLLSLVIFFVEHAIFEYWTKNLHLIKFRPSSQMKGMGCITLTFEIELFSFSFKNSKEFELFLHIVQYLQLICYQHQEDKKLVIRLQEWLLGK